MHQTTKLVNGPLNQIKFATHSVPRFFKNAWYVYYLRCAFAWTYELVNTNPMTPATVCHSGVCMCVCVCGWPFCV